MTMKRMMATQAMSAHKSHESLPRIRIRRTRLFDPRNTLAGR
jgi:hypothetical protein